METVYLVRSWRMSSGMRYIRRTGEEDRVFTDRKDAESWLLDNLFLRSEKKDEPYGIGEDWYHKDSTEESFVRAKLLELPLNDREESKFYHLRDFV